VSIASAGGVETAFQAKPASSYPHRQATDKVTIAAEQCITDEQTKDAFGKLNPWRYGVLPVLIVIQNDSPDAVRLDQIRFIYVLPDRSRVESTLAADLKYLNGAKQPSTLPNQIPIPIRRKSKSPLAAWEIEGRAFSAKIIPPGQSASGFVYFQTPNSSEASSVYISGLVDAKTGGELYYFEIPLSGN